MDTGVNYAFLLDFDQEDTIMKPIRTLIVTPALPPELEHLRFVAFNLRWAWNQAALALFRRLDSDLWEASGHNPVLMLGTVDQARLEAAAADEGFLSHLDGVYQSLQGYLKAESTWFHHQHGAADQPLIAYFSAEFGVTESLSIFAGGLGMLAGDHLKSASDLGLPLVGVGLLYQQGYFSQYLNDAGWQQEKYIENDFHTLPVVLELHADGSVVQVEVTCAGRKVHAQVWRAQVGRIPLYLLDTNIESNAPVDRDITDQLYGGDQDMRIRQEILLGIGGLQVLKTLGLDPGVYHMNEGHSAFLGLERIRLLMESHQLTFQEAREAASAGLVFTTHTPVAAGQDYFSAELMERYFGDYARLLGLSWRDFLALGRQNPDNDSEPYCMTILALRLASYRNGVSRLHGQVSRNMWLNLWPGLPEDEIPITHVTNGAHFRSWLSQEMDQLYERYLGTRWQQEPTNQSFWQRSEFIPAEELWRTHERRRERLVAFTRRRLREQLERRGASQGELETAVEVLDPEALTIGFARRFATYKRATLLLTDPERLAYLLNNPEHPVQIIFAGKAHPQDQPGKELVRRIVELARQERFRRRLIFLENYDMTIARYLVQGCDVWLNNPLRPQEASGTSGMKAAANGVLNLSTLDGWWDEAYRPENGWAIGRGETYSSPDDQWQVEAQALYGLLEQDVIPKFYDRGTDKLPRRWISRMKQSIQQLCYFFNTHRMVGEYTTRFYLPALANSSQLAANEMARARALADWKRTVALAWPRIRVLAVESAQLDSIQIGTSFTVRTRIDLAGLTPADVSVELYAGRVNPAGEITGGQALTMDPVGPDGDAFHLFEITTQAKSPSGQYGYTVRVLPRHPDLVSPYQPGLVTWA
jgi:glycogen phosphorylase